VADHPLDARPASAQAALDRVDLLVHGERRIHLAVEVDDFPVRDFAHAHVVHLANLVFIWLYFAYQIQVQAVARPYFLE
jgi:hypothetical protein